MGSRLLRRAVRRRPPRALAAAADSSPSAGPCAEDAALLSCPAPFCPSGGAGSCQSAAAVPADCDQRQRHMTKRREDAGTAWEQQDLRQKQSRKKRPSASDMPHSDRHAFEAYKKNSHKNVNEFTNGEQARGSCGSHPLAQAAGQWQRQARRAREEAYLREQEAEKAAAVSSGAESVSALPCSAAEQQGDRSAGREEVSPPLPSSWRKAGREEVLAWRRPARRSSASPVPAQEEPSLSERRLNKVIAEAGCCSRRKADELIFAGRVAVNGEVETHAGRRICPDDEVSVDGKPLAGAQQMLYLMLHKPVHVVSTAADPQGRQTVLSLVARAYPGVRLFPVGRLDYFSEGLILLTNDGRLAQRLMHPRHHLPKEYEVLVRNVVTQKALQSMRSGMRLAEGEELLPVEVTARSTSSGCTLLRMVLRQGVNRQIRRMCRDLGLTILRLRRVAIGPLQLGKLGTGQYRLLEEAELAALRWAVGLR